MWKSLIPLGGSFLLALPVMASDPVVTEKGTKEPISETQFISDQRAMFSKADKDFNGIVSFEELAELKSEKLRAVSEERFKRFDLDSSGYLTESELLEAHKVFENRYLDSAERNKNNLYKTYDLDKNGTISSYEIDEVYENKVDQILEQTKDRSDRDFRVKDKDKSGVVTLEEYVASRMPKVVNSGVYRGLGEQLSRDKNGDGMITRAEHTELIAKLFSKLDQNEDGELSAKEQEHKAFGKFQSFDGNKFFFTSSDPLKITR